MGVAAEIAARPGGLHRVSVPPGSTTVEVTLVPDGDETLVRLVHTGLPGPGEVAQHSQGWDRYLDRLVIAAGGGDPGPDLADGYDRG